MEITIQQAVAAHHEGKLEEAERLYRSLLEANPNNLDANNNLGVLLFNLSRFSEAEKYFKKVIKLKPDYAETHNNLGCTFKNLKNLYEAEISFNKAIELKPDHADANYNLGNLLSELKRLDEAETSFNKVIKLKPDHAETHNNLGNILRDLKRFDDAEVSFRKATELKPNYIVAHFNLANTLHSLDRLDEAEISFRKTIDLKPDYVEGHNNLGNTLLDLKKLDEAEVSFNKAIKLNPNLTEAHFNLGIILKDLKKYDEAEVSFNKAIKLKPFFAEAYNNLGTIAKMRNKFIESLGYFNKIIKFDSDYAKAKINKDNFIKKAVPGWHLSMMNDTYRNSQYLEAIKLAIKDIDDSSLVLDIGTGSGLLSMMAAANGAGEIIACEVSDIIAETAKKIIHKNGYEKKITIINKKSTELKIGEGLPRKADLIISEILSAEFVGEGVRDSLLDANKRLLKKDGIMIPESGTIKISLIGSNNKFLNSVSVANVNGFDLSEFNSISQRKWGMHLTEKPALLSNHENAFNIDLYNKKTIREQQKIIELKTKQDGLCLGVIQWMKIQLYKDIEYENNPGSYLDSSTGWPTPIYLFDKPITVKKGQIVKIKAFLSEDNIWFS